MNYRHQVPGLDELQAPGSKTGWITGTRYQDSRNYRHQLSGKDELQAPSITNGWTTGTRYQGRRNYRHQVSGQDELQAPSITTEWTTDIRDEDRMNYRHQVLSEQAWKVTSAIFVVDLSFSCPTYDEYDDEWRSVASFQIKQIMLKIILYIQGVHQILCFFPNFLKYSELCFPSVSVCVHTTGR